MPIDSVAIADTEQMEGFSSHEVVLDYVDILVVLLWCMWISPFLRLKRNQRKKLIFFFKFPLNFLFLLLINIQLQLLLFLLFVCERTLIWTFIQHLPFIFIFAFNFLTLDMRVKGTASNSFLSFFF